MEAVCGQAAEDFVRENLEALRLVGEIFKNPKDLVKSVESLQHDNAQLEKRIESLEARQLVGIRNELLQKTRSSITSLLSVISWKCPIPILSKLCFDLKNHVHDHLVLLCANIGGRAHVAVSVSDTVVAARNLDAAAIIRDVVSPMIKGGGGGQKHWPQPVDRKWDNYRM